MTVSLDFDASHGYAETLDGIGVPATLRIGNQSVELQARVDTGAAHCIFERRYAEMLGLEVESGRLMNMKSVSRLSVLSFPRLYSSPKTHRSTETFWGEQVGWTACASRLSTMIACCF